MSGDSDTGVANRGSRLAGRELALADEGPGTAGRSAAFRPHATMYPPRR
jgi:hypothetical protein